MTNSVNVWEYLKEYEEEKKEILSAVERVLSSGQLILGKEVNLFEEEFCNYLGISEGVGVNSATDALKVALKALGVGVGDEVITTSNTAVPTVSAIRETGADVLFIDIDPDTFNINPDLIENHISSKTKALVVVHLYGQCANMDRILEVAKKYNLKVVEDCAQAHGAEYQGLKAGTFGDASAFSFYPTKILGGFGDGGMVCTDNPQLAAKIRQLRFYGMKSTYFSEIDGYNSRLDEVHAAILRFKLTKLEKYIFRRREIAKVYLSELTELEELTLPYTANNCRHAYYVFVVKHKRRDQFIKQLRENNINANISYPWPIHTMPPYKKFIGSNYNLPVTEKIQKEIFSLPMFPSLTDEKLDYVIQNIKAICRNLR